MTIELLAVSPGDAARAIGLSKRMIYNLIDRGKLVARKLGPGRTARTLIDVASIRAYYASLAIKEGPEPLFDPVPKARPKAKRKTRH